MLRHPHWRCVSVAPDRYCEAHELLFADDVDEDELVIETKGDYEGQHALLGYEGDDELDEVILGERVCFVVPQPEVSDETETEEREHPGAGEPMEPADGDELDVSGDGAAEDHAEPEPAAA